MSVRPVSARRHGTPPVDGTIEALRVALAGRPTKLLHGHRLIPAAVLVLLYAKNGDYCVLLNVRTNTVEHHKGEISFPGGARDPEDPDDLATALRETYEEMGIHTEDVAVLGQLDEVATRSGYAVRVFVGTIPYPYPFKPSPLEIAQVLEVPVKALLAPGNRREEVRWVDGKGVTSYGYAHGGHLVFGVTAQILTQSLQLAADTVQL